MHALHISTIQNFTHLFKFISGIFKYIAKFPIKYLYVQCFYTELVERMILVFLKLTNKMTKKNNKKDYTKLETQQRNILQ